MGVVDRFLQERPLSYRDAMESSPREHLVEFWNWLDSEGYLTGLPPEGHAKLRGLIEGVCAARSELTTALSQVPDKGTLYPKLVEVQAFLERALEPFQSLQEYYRRVPRQSSDKDPDHGPSPVD